MFFKLAKIHKEFWEIFWRNTVASIRDSYLEIYVFFNHTRFPRFNIESRLIFDATIFKLHSLRGLRFLIFGAKIFWINFCISSSSNKLWLTWSLIFLLKKTLIFQIRQPIHTKSPSNRFLRLIHTILWYKCKLSQP